MKRKLAAADSTMLVAGLAAGCGGGDDKQDTGPTKTATAQRRRRCRRPSTSRAPTRSAATTRASSTTAGAKFRTRRPTKTGKLPPRRPRSRIPHDRSRCRPMSGCSSKLRELTPPERDKRTIVAYIVSLEGAINDGQGRSVPKYAQADADDPFDDANDSAKTVRHEGLRRIAGRACGLGWPPTSARCAPRASCGCWSSATSSRASARRRRSSRCPTRSTCRRARRC